MKLINKILCWVFGHDFTVTQELLPHSRRVCCTACHQMFWAGPGPRWLAPWDESFHKVHEEYGIKIKYEEWEGG